MSLVEETADSLGSAEALALIARDPYWPKWDGPWWKMTLLWEMGEARKIPLVASKAMLEALKTHFIPRFPLPPEKLPEGRDPYRHILCFCAAGTMLQVLRACGHDVDAEAPWIRTMLLDNQLPDGGWNCEEKAYAGSRKSSIVSTVPVLEALLGGPDTEALDRGAQYLIAHRLTRSSKGALIDPGWQDLCFPRFYYYDMLRGLTFLSRWSKERRRPLPPESVAEAWDILGKKVLKVERDALVNRSYNWDGKGWSGGPAARFALLDEVSKIGQPCPYLKLPA